MNRKGNDNYQANCWYLGSTIGLKTSDRTYLPELTKYIQQDLYEYIKKYSECNTIKSMTR